MFVFYTASIFMLVKKILIYYLLGLYQGQMYVQHPPRKQIENSKTNTFTERLALEAPTFGRWRPLISTSPSRTPTLNLDKDSNALSSVDYPFGKLN